MDFCHELVQHFSFINLKSKWCIKLRMAMFGVQTEQIETLGKFHASGALSCFIIIPLRFWNAIWTCYRFMYRLHFTAQKRKTNRLFNRVQCTYLRTAHWWVKAVAQGERVGAVSLFPFNSWVRRAFYLDCVLCTVPFYLMNWYYGEFSKVVIYVIKARNTLRYYSRYEMGEERIRATLKPITASVRRAIEHFRGVNSSSYVCCSQYVFEFVKLNIHATYSMVRILKST